jgi:hypothetical protein
MTEPMKLDALSLTADVVARMDALIKPGDNGLSCANTWRGAMSRNPEGPDHIDGVPSLPGPNRAVLFWRRGASVVAYWDVAEILGMGTGRPTCGRGRCLDRSHRGVSE